VTGAKRRAETVSSRDNSRASESIGVQRPRRGPNDDATTAHVERSGVQQSSTTSHRYP
jgi:hypothetical protein